MKAKAIMSLNELVTQVYNTFQDEASNARVILLHPRSRYRSVLVARLIEEMKPQVVYYAMGPDDINLDSFISGMMHDLSNQHPAFGRHLNILSQSAFANVDTLVKAFVDDLAEITSEPFLFILDEYDRSDSADDIQVFVEKLTSKLPDNCRMVINSRSLPRLSWISLVAQKRAILMEDHEIIKTNFHDSSTQGKTSLEVFALGPGHVLLEGQTINTWEGHLPRLLFFFSLDRPIVTRSEICHAFWPDLDSEQAVNVFHVTKRRLHKALNMDVLVHEGGYYRVNPELALRYDVMDFVSALMEGRDESNPNPVAAWQRAIDLYRGPFLQGHTDDWIKQRRLDFQAGYLEALSQMAHVRLKEGRYEHALSLLQRALNEDPGRESLHRDIMSTYARLGRRSEAAAHFQRLSDDLKKQGRQPEASTQTLYTEILAQ
jgi:DNA-binding SARP family transcriptional activator